MFSRLKKTVNICVVFLFITKLGSVSPICKIIEAQKEFLFGESGYDGKKITYCNTLQRHLEQLVPSITTTVLLCLSGKGYAPEDRDKKISLQRCLGAYLKVGGGG